MLASELFKILDRKIPPELAVAGDKIGFSGPGDPQEISVENVGVVLDLPYKLDETLKDSDVVVCHHPPVFKPEIPVYVVHSNWDIVNGGANDALAGCLGLKVLDIFDEKTGIGRICSASTTLKKFMKKVLNVLPTNYLSVVKAGQDEIERVAVVSGFGLNMKYMELAADWNVDLYISGDLDHRSAVLARKLGVNVLDATHHATEIPGLEKLSELISGLGLETEISNPGVPWEIVSSSQ